MSAASHSVTILCNGAKLKGHGRKQSAAVVLDYLGTDAKVKLKLPDFVRDVVHLPNRVLDLLEIAAYVFAADRSISRGAKDAMEFHAWSRSMRFVIKVRDHEFWKQRQVQQHLGEALNFMSGDRSYDFSFQPGHSTPATNLFDREGFVIAPEPDTHVAMFSGGLDSLAGIVETLSQPGTKMCLVSHQSGQTGTVRTQNQLFGALERRYPKRLSHYKFKAGLQGERAEEETQRTRAFLYTSTAFALAHGLQTRRMVAFENGITAINFARRGDLLNARASRTTHPKTMRLMQVFLSDVLGEEFLIETPYIWKTKTDVMKVLADQAATDFITSTVSCSKTFQKMQNATQCGGCSQCIDRRFAAYASDLHDVDEPGLYAFNFLKETIKDQSVRTTLLDFVRQAKHFSDWNVDDFQQKLLAELTDVAGYVDQDEQAVVAKSYQLCVRHGEQIAIAIRRMREINDHPFKSVPEGSFLKMIGDREYLNEPRADCTQLAASFDSLPTGNNDASAYEKLILASLEAIFAPDLSNPVAQQRLDAGRAKIDITFDNKATQGFFAHVRDTHRRRCPYIFFECKNYGADIGNSEFAQLEERMRRMHSEVGFVVYRKVADQKSALKQCQDRSGNGDGDFFVLMLDDADVKHLLGLRALGKAKEISDHLDGMLRSVLFKPSTYVLLATNNTIDIFGLGQFGLPMRSGRFWTQQCSPASTTADGRRRTQFGELYQSRTGENQTNSATRGRTFYAIVVRGRIS